MTTHDPNKGKNQKSADSSVGTTAPARRVKEKKKVGNVFLSGLKNFIIIFVVCLVIFGLLATLAVTLVTSEFDDIFEEKNELEEILKKDSEEASAHVDDSPLPDGESFTVFIAVTDYDPAHFNYYPRGESLEKLREKAGQRNMGVLSAGYKTISTKLNAIVRFDKERREYTVTPVSSHTKVFTPSGYKQLGDIFYEFGPQYLIDKVSAVTGIGIDYYMFFDANEASKIATALGGFNVEVSKDIYTDGAAFGTAERSYGNVPGVTPPETVPPETKKPETDKKETDDDGSPLDSDEVTEEATTPAPETTTKEDETEEPEDEKEPREAYHRVCSAGTVTVNAGNVRALLMFDDYESSSSDERLQLEYQLVRGALLRLASMSDSERTEFYNSFMKETSVDDISVTLGPPRDAVTKINEMNLDDDDSESGDDTTEKKEDKEEIKDDKSNIKPITDPDGYDLLTDNMINTDISRKTAQLKSEMVGAAMRFPVKHLEFSGRDANGYFIASNENASRFFQFKMPPDPEKIVSKQ